jgi:hypothetical protein
MSYGRIARALIGCALCAWAGYWFLQYAMRPRWSAVRYCGPRAARVNRAAARAWEAWLCLALGIPTLGWLVGAPLALVGVVWLWWTAGSSMLRP